MSPITRLTSGLFQGRTAEQPTLHMLTSRPRRVDHCASMIYDLRTTAHTKNCIRHLWVVPILLT